MCTIQPSNGRPDCSASLKLSINRCSATSDLNSVSPIFSFIVMSRSDATLKDKAFLVNFQRTRKKRSWLTCLGAIFYFIKLWHLTTYANISFIIWLFRKIWKFIWQGLKHVKYPVQKQCQTHSCLIPCFDNNSDTQSFMYNFLHLSHLSWWKYEGHLSLWCLIHIIGKKYAIPTGVATFWLDWSWQWPGLTLEFSCSEQN